MKSTGRFIFLFSVLLFTSYKTFAQLGYDERERIKEELTRYLREPELYKRNMDDLNAQFTKQNDRIKELERQLEEAKGTATSTGIQYDNTTTTTEDSRKAVSTEYKIQIGTYSQYSINNLLSSNPKFVSFETIGGRNTYFVDGFSDPNEAYNLAKELRRMGLTDAFVTKYVNKNRVSYDHVAETGADASGYKPRNTTYSTSTSKGTYVNTGYNSTPKSVSVNTGYSTPSNPNKPVYINTGYSGATPAETTPVETQTDAPASGSSGLQIIEE